MSLLLLVGAGLFLGSLQNLRNVDSGFDTSQVLVVCDRSARGRIRTEQLTRSRPRPSTLHAIPGVESASLSLYSLLGGSTSSGSVQVEGYTFAENEDRDTEKVDLDLAVLRDRRHAPPKAAD